MQESSLCPLGWEDPWRREWLSTPVFWPGELHGLYSPWGCKEFDMTEQLMLDKQLWNGFKHSAQFSSASQSYPTLCKPMDCSRPGFPVHHQLLKLAQTHANQVGDAIQPSHPLLSPFPPAFNLSQHQSLPMSHFFTSGGQSIRASASASVLPMNIQD